MADSTSYTVFTTSDIVSDVKQEMTTAVWSNSSGSLSTFFTSSIQSSSNGDYYFDAYHQNPDTTSTAEVQFAVAYGHRFGSGSGQISSDSGDQGLTPSRAIYSQYRNFLLPKTAEAFTINTWTTDQIFVVNFNRARTPESLDPGNWELSLSGSKGLFTFIDNSTLTEPNVTEGGNFYHIVLGSINAGVTTPTAPTYVGVMYPQHSLLIFDANIIANTLGQVNIYGSSQALVVSASGVGTAGDYGNHGKFLQAIKNAASVAGYEFKARNSEEIRSQYFFVRVKNGEYNYSTNPSFYSGSFGVIRNTGMLGNPQVYITTVGLYNENNELLAVAKLSQPLAKNFHREALIRIKLDFVWTLLVGISGLMGTIGSHLLRLFG